MVPQLEWPLAVGGAEAADEVVFEGLDCTFGSVDAVIGGLDELPFAIVLAEVCFERCCRLI